MCKNTLFVLSLDTRFLKPKPLKTILRTNSVDDTSNTTHNIPKNRSLQQRRNLFKSNRTMSHDTSISVRKNLRIDFDSDGEISLCNERLLPICEYSDQHNPATPSSTTSGCTSSPISSISSISSIQSQRSITSSYLDDEIQDERQSPVANLYQVNPNNDLTILASPIETKIGLFSKIFGTKSSKTLNNTSRTCSIM